MSRGRSRIAVLGASLAALIWSAVPAADASARSREVVADAYIVVLKDSVPSVGRETDALERGVGFSARLEYRHALKGFSAKLSPGQVRRLEADPQVDYVAPDRRVEATAAYAPNEPLAPTGIQRIEAANATDVRGASTVNVAVIDTGIDLTHPDLNAVSGKNCVTSGASPNDDNGHGSHVAGTIGGRNDGAGVVGVAPDTPLYAVKVLASNGSGTTSQVVCGIDWVTSTRTDADPANDIYVANMSLGGGGTPVKACDTTTDPEHQAICRSTAEGVTYVVAAGNDGWDFDYPSVPDTPAAYPQALTVTAVTDSDGQPGAAGGAPACRTTEVDDRYASFSNYALTDQGKAHTIAAPGVCIKSTYMNGRYDTISGTSMATPHMAGVVALCLGEAGGSSPAPCAGFSPAQIIAKMRSDAESYSAAPSGYGFTGDPLHAVGTRYYGYMTYVGSASKVTEPAPAPPTLLGYSPTGYSPFTGSVYSNRGSVSRLATNDGNRVEINAATSGGTYVSEIQPYAAISQSVLKSLKKLTVHFDGNVSTSSAALSVQIWNAAAPNPDGSRGAWETILAPRTGLTNDYALTWSNTTSPKDYVDPGTGTVRVRVRGTRSGGSFRTRTDWVRFRTES